MVKIKVIENSSKRIRVYYKEIKNKSSKYKGVYLKNWAKKKKWAVKISLDGRLFHIDSYEIEEEAAKSYDIVAQELIGGHHVVFNKDLFQLDDKPLTEQQLLKINKRISFVKENK
jgi:hypothetical protein